MRTKLYLIIFAILVTGCAPLPIQETPHVSGKVINSKTQQPIKNARLYYKQYPKNIIATSNDGNYDFTEIRDWQFILLGPYDSARRTAFLIIEAEGFISKTKELPIFVKNPPLIVNIDLEPI